MAFTTLRITPTLPPGFHRTQNALRDEEQIDSAENGAGAMEISVCKHVKGREEKEEWNK